MLRLILQVPSSVMKFRRRSRFLEMYVRVLEKGILEARNETIIEWCADALAWLGRRNELILTPKSNVSNSKEVAQYCLPFSVSSSLSLSLCLTQSLSLTHSLSHSHTLSLCLLIFLLLSIACCLYHALSLFLSLSLSACITFFHILFFFLFICILFFLFYFASFFLCRSHSLKFTNTLFRTLTLVGFYIWNLLNT